MGSGARDMLQLPFSGATSQRPRVPDSRLTLTLTETVEHTAFSLQRLGILLRLLLLLLLLLLAEVRGVREGLVCRVSLQRHLLLR